MTLLWLLMGFFGCFDIQNIDEQNACIDYYLESIEQFGENLD